MQMKKALPHTDGAPVRAGEDDGRPDEVAHVAGHQDEPHGEGNADACHEDAPAQHKVVP